MTDLDKTYDVAVIGGGLAGVSAARDLRDRGHSVVLLEGSDRLGGRIFARPFKGLPDVSVDFGGTWVNTSMQPLIRNEISRYGIALKEDSDPGCSAFHTGGVLRSVPIPAREIPDLQRALTRLRDASLRFTPGHAVTSVPVRDLDISVDDFFAPLDLPAATRDLLDAMVVVYGGWNPGALSVFSFLSQVAALGNEPDAFYGALTERFVGGLHVLLEAMVADSGVEVLFRHRAVAVERGTTGLTVRADNGVALDARECIVAVPSNVIRHIDFMPSLSLGKVKMVAENHMSRAIKCAIRVRNLAPRPFAMGSRGFHMICSGKELGDGTEIVYGFSSEYHMDFDPRDRERVQDWVREYFPSAEVVEVDFHDFGADPLLDGTYRIDRPGEAFEFLTVMNEPEDRIVFAGTDVDDSVWRTWMEGALSSSRKAVGVVTENLHRHTA
ncbi:FAD-dependent oxidoreductase [Saccharopolyspora karakumensis]|uniref:FAD-dependent oxidoreductase n=1 Tax=Saccharopolyspora karakumensis TaxID=2530386 RepID=A0A4V2YXR5_9PSEU|nr:NAD(P)/FAD-dependent oxidoreductase [Saccharopolyspora karakumensis]TDD90527.1 FAD-dependent oxidoreductase [Saccharopolyspora karakumensis]